MGRRISQRALPQETFLKKNLLYFLFFDEYVSDYILVNPTVAPGAATLA